MFEMLFDHLARFVHLNEPEREILLAKLKYKKVSKKDFLSLLPKTATLIL